MGVQGVRCSVGEVATRCEERHEMPHLGYCILPERCSTDRYTQSVLVSEGVQ